MNASYRNVAILLKEALAAQNKGNLHVAESLYRKALNIVPTHPIALRGLALAAAQKGQENEAISLFIHSIRKYPKLAEFRTSYIKALVSFGRLELAKSEAAKAGEFGLLDKNIQKVDECISQMLQKKYREFFNNFNAGHHQKVCEDAQEFLRKNPDSFFSWKILGASLMNLDRVGEALEAMNQALEIKENDAETWANLSAAQKLQGDIPLATRSMQKAISINSARTEWHYSLGNLYLSQGLFDDAIKSYKLAIEGNPKDYKAYCNLGVALERIGADADAYEAYKLASCIEPGSVDALSNLGNLYQKKKQLDIAISTLRRAVDLDPDHPEALNNLARCLYDYQELDEAEYLCRRALTINPGLYPVLVNLGNILKTKGKLSDAADFYKRAIEIDSEQPEAYNNLGCSLRDFGRPSESIAYFREAIRLRPNYPAAYSNLGNAFKDVGNFTSAIESLKCAIALDSKLVEAHSNLGSVYKDIGNLSNAIECFEKAINIDPFYLEAQSNLLFSLNFSSIATGEQRRKIAERYGDFSAKKRRFYYENHNNKACNDFSFIRIGFVSGDFRNHAVGYFLEGVMQELSRGNGRNIQLIAFSNNPIDDDLTQRLRPLFDEFYCVQGMSDQKLAESIYNLNVDILIDLAGHTRYSRLPVFSYKPAPVQVAWLGYFGTTGVSEIDYLIADDWSLPKSAEGEYTEQIARLPYTRFCFTPPQFDVEIGPSPLANNGYITFGCFNNLSKINREVIALWATILQSIPRSKIVFKSKQLRDEGVCRSLRETFSEFGVCSDRLVLQGPDNRRVYLNAYNQVDITLDPFPYPGGTTTVESLWMGVPVLTLSGDNLLSRQGVCLLSNVELYDWVASDKTDYHQRAVKMSEAPELLIDYRENLRETLLASPICNSKLFAKDLTALFRSLWSRYCASK